MSDRFQQIAGVVSIVAGLAAIAVLWETRPGVAFLTGLLVLSGVVLVL